MKVLQTKNTPDGKPRVLKMGVDFDVIDMTSLNTQTIQVLYGDDLTPKHLSTLSDFKNKKNIQYGEDIASGYRLLGGFNEVCSLSDCYQSRPLIELGSWCEFNVYLHCDYQDGDNCECVIIYDKFKSRFIMIDINYEQDEDGEWYNGTSDEVRAIEVDEIKDYKDLGELFTSKNQKKYPELYEKALKIINNK